MCQYLVGMDRLEVREMEYFIAVAETLHFGRAAETLGIAQPPLSRAIRRLERRLGVSLLERTSRRVELTAAGVVFDRECREVLAAADRAAAKARRAAQLTTEIVAVRPGTAAGVLSALTELHRRHRDAGALEVLFTERPTAAVRAGEADFAVVCTSAETEGMNTLVLAVESPIALLPATHPLAARTSLKVSEMRDDARFKDSCEAAGFDEIIDRVALEQLLVVAGGGVVGRLPASVAAIPVVDLPNAHLALAWTNSPRSAAGNRLLRDAESMAAAPVTSSSANSVPA